MCANEGEQYRHVSKSFVLNHLHYVLELFWNVRHIPTLRMCEQMLGKSQRWDVVGLSYTHINNESLSPRVVQTFRMLPQKDIREELKLGTAYRLGVLHSIHS